MGISAYLAMSSGTAAPVAIITASGQADMSFVVMHNARLTR
jgi:uncharacterized membrane protein AbrB (regulator of aidB expression)